MIWDQLNSWCKFVPSKNSNFSMHRHYIRCTVYFCISSNFLSSTSPFMGVHLTSSLLDYLSDRLFFTCIHPFPLLWRSSPPSYFSVFSLPVYLCCPLIWSWLLSVLTRSTPNFLSSLMQRSFFNLSLALLVCSLGICPVM